MTLTHFAIIAVCAYLLGSLSFAIIVSKVTLGKDIRNYGSGNAGLTNAYRTMGAKKTLFVLLGDIAKGAAAVSVGWALGGPVGKLTAGIFVILGHMFPLYFGFKGGKGIATGFGVIVAFNWPTGIVGLVTALAGAALSRRMSVGSIAAAVVFPIMFFFVKPDYFIWSVCLAVIVLWRHRANIVRLAKGEEPPMSFSKKKDKDSAGAGTNGEHKKGE